MMSGWALSICAVGILTGIVRMITPRMKLGDAVDTILSLLVLIAVMSPILLLSGQVVSLELPRSEPENINAQAQDLAITALRMSLTGEIENITQKMGIKARGVRIDIDVTGSQYNVSSIVVYLGQEWESRHDEIITRLRDGLGQVVYISYNEEEKI